MIPLSESSFEDPLVLLRRLLKRVWNHTSWCGRYGPEKPIAGGTYGDVTLSRDLVLGRKVVIKRLNDQASEYEELKLRFIEEAQITAQLQHPHVMPVHDIGIDGDGRLFFTMSYARGGTLDDMLADAAGAEDARGRHRAVEQLARVAAAMAFAHGRGAVHRDLKPKNILLGRHGETYVGDWGNASALRMVGGGSHGAGFASEDELVKIDRDERLDGSYSYLGSPGYMSPEQAWRDVDGIGPHSDVYAIGAMLYRLLAGTPPHIVLGERAGWEEICERVRGGPPVPLDDCASGAPAELVKIAEGALSAHPDDRPSTERLAEQLRTWWQRREGGQGGWFARAARKLRGSAQPHGPENWSLQTAPVWAPRAVEDVTMLTQAGAPAGKPPAPRSSSRSQERPVHHARYADRGLLGFGGLAEVREVEDRVLRRRLAMKTPRQEGTGSLGNYAAYVQREARIVAQLDHPRVPRAHDAGELEDGRPFFVMDVFPEGSASQFFAAQRGSGKSEAESARDVLGVGVQLCAALGHAHDRGVTHRDIKPSNVFVGDFGQVILGDWGLAQYRPAQRVGTASTVLSIAALQDHDDARIGTPSFMAPECAEGMSDMIGPWSDLWSLAASLLTLLRGRPVRQFSGTLEGAAFAEWLRQPLGSAKQLAPMLSKRAAEVFDKALVADPGLRIESAQAFGDELRVALQRS